MLTNPGVPFPRKFGTILLRNPAEDELVVPINTAVGGICRFYAELLIYFNGSLEQKVDQAVWWF